MANLLGHKAWNRTKKCKRINCCNRPRRSHSGQRLNEKRQWGQDWIEETSPETPDWVERYAAFQSARWGFPLYREWEA